ncbi:MAG: FkbM family methyltransferase [Candidatus Acidiferrales bacterium]|jgi:FkbM family methyltransferase
MSDSSALKNIVRSAVPRSVRNWLRSPSRSAEWLWDSAAFSLGQTKTLQLAPNVSLLCHPHFYKVVETAQIHDPDQAEEFRSFLSHCSARMFLFDIGAHFGVFSLALAQFGGKAVAADPSPIATKMIETEVALNKCGDRVRVLQAAVSDVNGEMGLVSSGTFSEGYFKVEQGRLASDLTPTQALTVDQMSVRYGAPTHVKIDVEGHEAAVLRGAKETIAKHSPLLFLELHSEMVRDGGGDPNETLNLVESAGYRTFDVAGQPIGRDGIFSKPIIRIVAEHVA